MEHAVETHHHGAQRLCRADVRCGFLALDMLLARLQCQAERGATVGIFAQSDDTPGYVALELIARSHIACGRSAEAHRQA